MRQSHTTIRRRQVQVLGLLLLLSLGTMLLAPHSSCASTPGGGKFPLQNFCREAYDAGVGTYIPFILFIVLLVGVTNWFFGWWEFGQMSYKVALVFFLLGGGTAYLINLVGGHAAAAATLVP